MQVTKVSKKYLIIFLAGIFLPYVFVFALLKYLDPDGFLITAWILLFPIITYPIWLKRLKKAKAKEAAEQGSVKSM